MSEENNNANNPPPPPADPGATPPSKRPGYDGPPPDNEARTWGMLAHLAVLAGYIIPFGNILGPLVVWLVKKDQMPFVDDQGKESVNFQIMMTIALIICVVLICAGIGLILLPIVGIADLVFIIIAAIKANKGVAYRYPFNIRLIK